MFPWKARIKLSIIVIKPRWMWLVVGAVAVMLPLFAMATEQDLASVDARFDKTGDHLVDMRDWKRMSAAERLAYAHASLLMLGIDPYSKVHDGKNRVQQYLDGLNRVYQ